MDEHSIKYVQKSKWFIIRLNQSSTILASFSTIPRCILFDMIEFKDY